MSRRRRRRAAPFGRPKAGGPPVGRPVGPSAVTFVAAIGLAAFLLFTLELLVGRLVLPVFGGAPGVWTTALVLFTGLLFVGYLYAHVVATRLSPSQGGLLHLALIGLVVTATLLAPVDVARLRLPGVPEALNVLYAVLLLYGAPIFLLATTTPLLSAWFAGRGGDPWWLYAVSNGTSFVALLAYPLVIEPNLPLSLQRALMAGGLLLYAAVVAAIVVRGRPVTVAASPLPATVPADPLTSTAPPKPLGLPRQLRWLMAAFVPAGLLAATTSFIATDLISAPLVWVGPLGIYLASFVIAFSEVGRRSLRFVEVLVPAAATLLWVPFVLDTQLPVGPLLGVELGSYAVLAIAIHGRLALDRPDTHDLTRFYLILAAGGLLATAFVALLAPLIFSAIYEYPLLIVALIAVLATMPGPPAPGLLGPIRSRLGRLMLGGGLQLLPFAVVGGLLWLLLADAGDVASTVGLLLIAGGAVILIGRTPALLATATAVSITIAALALLPPTVARVRTFFGVTEIRAESGPAYVELSGTTIHGVQFRDSRAREPTTYYVRAGPLGDVFSDLRARTGRADVGVVGLGTGTIAAYAVPDDRLTFFEINPAVVELAASGQYFTYLRDAPVSPRIVLGDARLSLEEEPDASYDVLVFDAFSSDAVPTHLLTREAMEMYARKLRPGGLLVFHVSNRYYDLAGAVIATARSMGLAAADLSYQPGPERMSQLSAFGSEWVVVGAREDVDRFLPLGWSSVLTGPVLTDDYSDLLQLLR